MRQPGPCVRLCATVMHCSKGRTWNSTLHTALFTLHTLHLHFTPHTSSHLISSELFSPHLRSSHLISSLLICHPSFSQVFFISSEHCSTFLISPKLFSTHLSSSARWLSDRILLHPNPVARRKFLHTEAWDTDAFTQKSTYTQKASAHGKPLHSTLLHREAFTHRSFCTQHAFTQRSFYTQQTFAQKSFYTEKRLCAEKLLQREAFRDRCVYARKLLQRKAFTHRSLLTEPFTY